MESGLIEIIKYGSKIFTEPDLKRRAKETETAHIYLKALDTILTAMKGKGIFDRFGFNAPPEDKPQQYPAKLLADYREWEYCPKSTDWIDTLTGEVLTDYKMPSHLQVIIDSNIDLKLA